MSLGQAPQSEDVFWSSSPFCRERLSPTSIYELLYRESHRLFPDEDFADLFAGIGRHSVPPRIVAVVMVLHTLLYDAVATQDTVTLVRSAIRSLLSVAEAPLWARLRAVCGRDDDYLTAGKPVCDWQDEAAREALIDALSRDAYALLALLDGERLTAPMAQAVKLLSTVVGQDIEQGEDGMFRIVREVAKEWVISTVDPETRHGHNTALRSFDGYKGHIAVDPDSELITATEVTPGNAADGSVAQRLCPEVLAAAKAEAAEAATQKTVAPTEQAEPFAVCGDAAKGITEFGQKLEQSGVEVAP